MATRPNSPDPPGKPPVTTAGAIRRQDDIHSEKSAVLDVVAAAAAVGVITAIAFRFHLNLTTAAFLHLVIVVLIARRCGFWAASAVSALAVVCQLYFLVPPVLTWVVSDPQNWIALATFEYCALIVSSLSGQAARQALVATRRRAETEGLYEISRLVLIMDRGQEPAPQLSALIQRVFHCDTVGLFDPATNRFAAVGTADAALEANARASYAEARDWFDPVHRTWFCALRMGLRPEGALALRGGEIGETLARALASLVAVALERFRSLEKENRAEAARRSEQLRTAVLDALAHDIRTPLTAIRAASSGLLEVGGLKSAQHELVGLIDSEAGRLDEITSRLLGMARLDDGDVRPRPRKLRLDVLIRRVAGAFAVRAPDHAIRITGLTADLVVFGDEEMLGMGLTQLIDNAIKYSASGSGIDIRSTRSNGDIVVSVHNVGVTIPPEDRERIFERFYRASGTAHNVPGTGLGLSITRKIAVAHSGRVWVTSDSESGTTFFLSLPADGHAEGDPLP